MLGAGILGACPAAADEPRALPTYATRDFFDTLQRFDESPSDVGPTRLAHTEAVSSAAAPAQAPVPNAARLADAGALTPPGGMPHLPAPTPPREAPASWPKTIPEARAEASMDLAKVWPAVDIELAKARCNEILKSLDAVTIPEPPMRQGACGAPAPVRLISVGRKPEVSLSPPPLVTCDMVQALHGWITRDVQPAAKKTLAAQVVKIELMSDYSCRNAYGSRHGKLSEHARANALDIRGFLTAKGEMTAFLEDWGPTGREIREIAAREKAEAAKLAAQKAAEPPVQQAKPGVAQAVAATPQTPAESLSEAAAGLTRATIAEGLARIPTVPMTSKGAVASGFAASHLGGPKPARSDERKAAAAVEPAQVTRTNSTARASFLREVHASACKIFGTVLGPEANRAHRNHLHVDMADRSTGVFCE